MTRKNHRFYTHIRLFIFIGCLLLILGSGSIILILRNTSGSTRSSSAGNTTTTSHSTPAHATPTTTPTNPAGTGTVVGPTPTPTPIFTDNFIDNSQSWYMSNTGGYTRSLIDNGLTLTDTAHSPLIESLPTNHKFDDFILTTAVTFKQGSSNDSVGVYLRGDSNLDHDYRIDIFGNNTYAISKEFLDTNNQPQTFYIIAPSHTSPLRPLGTSNTLTIIMKGPTMILLINNNLVNVIIDEDYTHGQIALFVANSLTSPETTAIFSSIEIDSAPSQFPLNETCTIPSTPSITPTTTTTPTNADGATPTSCK